MTDALFQAIKTNNTDEVEKHVSHLTVENLCALRNEQGHTLLSAAIIHAQSIVYRYQPVQPSLAMVELINQLTKGKLLNERDTVDDLRGKTPLIHASEKGLTLIMAYLLEKGCDVDINISDADNLPVAPRGTALSHALYYKQLDAAALLLKHRADTACVDGLGYTPIHHLMSSSNFYVPQNTKPESILQACKGQVNTPTEDKSRHRPLHIATMMCFCPSKNMVHLLLEVGADPNLRKAHGNDPFRLLASNTDSPSSKAWLRLIVPYGYRNEPNKDGVRSFPQALYEEVYQEVYRAFSKKLAKDSKRPHVVSILKKREIGDKKAGRLMKTYYPIPPIGVAPEEGEVHPGYAARRIYAKEKLEAHKSTRA